MKLNDRSISTIQVRVKDYITNREYGLQINNYDDNFQLPERINLDVFELDRLLDSLIDMKKLIESDREHFAEECKRLRGGGTA